MRITLSAHARRRLSQRGLGESDIEAVLRRSRKPGRDADDNPIYRAMVGDLLVTVVIRKESHPPLVITVWFD
jgi:hypothetical protein